MALKQSLWGRIRNAFSRRKPAPAVAYQVPPPSRAVEIHPQEIPTHAVVQVVEPVAPSEKRALVFLSDSDEWAILRKLLVADGWTIGTYDSYQAAPGRPPVPGLVVADDVGKLALCESLFGDLPPAILVADDDDREVTAALDFGAHWVIRRPVDPENPFIEWT